MNLSRNWLNEFVTVTASDKEFAEEMTLSGSKVEVTEVLGHEISNVVVGKVRSFSRTPREKEARCVGCKASPSRGGAEHREAEGCGSGSLPLPALPPSQPCG